MKKILLTIFILFNFSFAGETGYIWIPNSNNSIDQAQTYYGVPFAYSKLSGYERLPDINNVFFIDNKIFIVKKKEYLDEIIKKFRILKKEEICELSTYSTLDFYKGDIATCSFFNEATNLKNKFHEETIYISNNKLEVKLLDIIRYVEGTFFEIEIINKGELIND